LKKEKKIDFLINNAGITLKYNFKNHLDYWNKTIHTNLTVPFYLSSISFNYLKKSSYPSIVNISSISSKIAMSNNPAYNASKGGLNSLTMSLAYDYSNYGIRVNAVCPGYIKTNMTKKSFGSKKLYKKRISRMITRNYGEPSDVANIVFFLCSKNSRYINAEEIVVDGGLIKKGI
jgi:NAD(P)-dependent dehydrogenase (short-subunit alcohol dehydrogenase family)